jgi:hypothetical protein
MTDHQLSTRDLAARSDSEEAESALEGQRPTGDTAAESSGSDASLTRDPAVDADTQAAGDGTEHEPLFPQDESERFTDRWQEIQTSFVDRPRDAVADADALVADLMQRLAASFSQERERLEAQWDRGDDVSTEDLRIALTRYRSFFDRLLSV